MKTNYWIPLSSRNIEASHLLSLKILPIVPVQSITLMKLNFLAKLSESRKLDLWN